MAIQDKQLLVSEFEENVGEFLTVVHARKSIDVLKTVLNDYDVERVADKENLKDDDILEAYLTAKMIEGRSSKTIKRYSYMLEKMILGIDLPASKITASHIRAYLSEESSRGVSGRSLEGLRQIMSSFFGWCFKEGLIKENPMGNIGTIKFKKDIKTPFSPLEIDRIKNACYSNRDKALVYFLLATGCRIGEVCRLRRNSIDFRNLECTVLGKGNKERVVYLDEVSASIVEEYLSERTDEDQALFCGIRGGLTEQGCRAILKQLELRSGVENVHPHRFRRTLATYLIDRGMPIQEVAYILGHSNINTTMTYVYVDKQNVKNAYHKYY